MKEPQILNIQKQENEVQIQLSFDEAAEYFQGHFPQAPILPGVAQVYFAVLYAKKHFKIIPNISAIKKLRFANIIQPNQEVNLRLKYLQDKNTVSFEYLSPTKRHSSGDLLLK